MNYTFGNSKEKEKIYYRKIDDKEMDHILETRTAICKSMAILLKRVLSEFDVNIIVEMDKSINRWHVYNVITLKDGRRFRVDLEEDLEYIQSGSKTQFFGELEGSKGQNIIDENELEKIDKEKADYIPWGFYFDDMIWMLKWVIKSPTIPLEEKLEMVLDNLNVYVNTRQMEYRELTYYHNRVFQEVFEEKELNKIHQINCCKKDGDNKLFMSCVVLDRPKENTKNVYIFSYKDNCYQQISMNELAELVNNGWTLDRGVSGLNGMLRRSKNKLTKCLNLSSIKSTNNNDDGR